MLGFSALLWIHVFLSTLALGVLCLAGVQALLVAVQDWQLRRKYTQGVVQFFPSLQTMESYLFQIIAIGFVLLSIVLVTSALFFYPLTPVLLEKTLVSLVAWIVFFVLLLGRYYLGWRGQTAIRWTLSGVFLLLLTYFANQLLPYYL